MGSYTLSFLILLFLSGLFSGSETALFSFSDSEIESLPLEKLRQKLKKLRSNPGRLLTSILLGNLLVNVVMAALITQAFYTSMGPRGISYAILFGTTVILIFGEIIPKTLAARFNSTYARVTCFFLPFFITLLKPFIFVAELITKPMIKAGLHFIPDQEEQLKKSEVITILKKGNSSILDPVEETILVNMLNIQLFSLKNIMNNIDHSLFIPDGMSIEEIRERFIRTKSDYLVVFKENYEHIKGILTPGSLLSSDGKGHPPLLSPLFVPSLKKVKDIIHALKTSPVALIVDEYGTVTGSLTYDNIMHYILQNITSLNPDIAHEKISRNSIIVHSATPVPQVNRLLNLKLDDSEAKTIGGYIEHLSGEIPKKGTVLSIPEVTFIILDAARNKINSIKIIRKRGKS
ncbi:MAG TPA: DUF21 domain-containing protein [Firmicutes bacterium]|nr:DUF21 domain-containing protein [Bacillota bacterium]